MIIKEFDTLDDLMTAYKGIIVEGKNNGGIASAYVGIYTTADEPEKIKHSKNPLVNFLYGLIYKLVDDPTSYKTAEQVLKNGHFEKGNPTDDPNLITVTNPEENILAMLKCYDSELKNNPRLALGVIFSYNNQEGENNFANQLLSIKGKHVVEEYGNIDKFIEKVKGAYEQQNIKSVTINGKPFEKDQFVQAWEFVSLNQDNSLTAKFKYGVGSTTLVYDPKKIN
jgi:hypothetical protein